MPALTKILRRGVSQIVGTPPPLGRAKVWMIITFVAALPTVVLLSGYAHICHNREKKEHTKKPEYIPYEYLNIRTKRWPWKDGERSLFHNPKKNFPFEYYDNEEEEEEH